MSTLIEDTNQYICEKLKSPDTFMITRFGWGAEPVLAYKASINFDSIPKLEKCMLEYHAGIYGIVNDDDALKRWCGLYKRATELSTGVGVWLDNRVHPAIKNSQLGLIKNNKTLLKADNIDPQFAVLQRKIPWTQYLLGKKVLIISPFVDSFKKQLDAGFKVICGDFEIFKDNQEFVFYKCYNTIAGNHIHKNWIATLDKMLNDINKLDFDIALVSCGGYGSLLCDYIHNGMHKSAIYVGGCLQILFGVTCTRYINDKWGGEYLNKNGLIRPSKEEQVQLKTFEELYGINNSNEVQNGCYW